MSTATTAGATPAAPDGPEVRGRIIVHPRGFGFLKITDWGAWNEGRAVASAFITPPDLNGFLSDDLVSARLTAATPGPTQGSAPGSTDARWNAGGLKLLSRPRGQLFGEVVQRRGAPFLRTDREISNTDWPLDTEGADAPPGGFAVARVVGQRLTLVRLLPSGADLALEQVIARHGLLSDFDEHVLGEAQAATHRAHGDKGRTDLRHVPTVTVDAVSTRDIDDAVAVLPAGPDGALRLLVSIADVSEFVRPGTLLDGAAQERGTSVYLSGRVLPMLPETLSSSWLSLLPGEERLCLTVELRVDPEGRVTAVDVYQSVIRSWARLNYDEMAAYLDRGELSPAMVQVKEVQEAMPWFRTAWARISVSRARRGGVRIATDETRIVVDTQGVPTGVENDRPTSAHGMIEHFMVAANEAVATWLSDRGVPAVYRVHDQPDAASVADLSAAARRFGFEAGFGKNLTPLSLLAFDTQISGSQSEAALRSVLRRSLGPARYTYEASPHFGLAAPLYLHYTSPIRRYADLQVHRMIKRYLHGERHFGGQDADETLPEHLNRRAAAATRAENDRRRILIARLMSGRIGELHPARITRVRPFGLVMFAEIDGSFLVEGTLPTDALPGGPYRTDPRETELIGPTRSFAIGMELRVRVVAADPLVGRIEFALDEAGLRDDGVARME